MTNLKQRYLSSWQNTNTCRNESLAGRRRDKNALCTHDKKLYGAGGLGKPITDKDSVRLILSHDGVLSSD